MPVAEVVNDIQSNLPSDWYTILNGTLYLFLANIRRLTIPAGVHASIKQGENLLLSSHLDADYVRRRASDLVVENVNANNYMRTFTALWDYASSLQQVMSNGNIVDVPVQSSTQQYGADDSPVSLIVNFTQQLVDGVLSIDLATLNESASSIFSYTNLNQNDKSTIFIEGLLTMLPWVTV